MYSRRGWTPATGPGGSCSPPRWSRPTFERCCCAGSATPDLTAISADESYLLYPVETSPIWEPVKRRTRLQNCKESVVDPEPITDIPSDLEQVGGHAGCCLSSWSTSEAAQVDRRRLDGPAGAGGESPGICTTPRSQTFVWSIRLRRRRRPCLSYLRIERLAGCVEYIPPFTTCLARGQLRAGRRRSPTATGPGRRAAGQGRHSTSPTGSFRVTDGNMHN